MGEQAKARRDRRSEKQVLEEFGIVAMGDDIRKAAAAVERLANAQTNLKIELQKKHDDLVRQAAKELNMAAQGIAQERSRIDALVEVRNRGFWGRLQWLATGK